jgi:hypothetical protein
MSSFFGLVKYVGIALLILMAVIMVVATLIGVYVAFSPTLIPGLFRS